MEKDEMIRKYGIEAYKKQLVQSAAWQAANPEKVKAKKAAWYAANPEKVKAKNAAWRAANPEKVKANHAKESNKGGKHYEKQLEYKRTGLQGEKHKVRSKHNRKYAPIKRIIDPDGLTQIHHEYLNDGTANYRGVALVEKDQHQHGYIDVIQILEGEITHLTEKEIRGNNER